MPDTVRPYPPLQALARADGPGAPTVNRTATLGKDTGPGNDASPAPAGPLRRWIVAHPLLADLLIVVVLDLLTIGRLVGPERGRWWSWLLDQLIVWPLVLRRRHPSPVFAVIAALALVQWVVGVRLGADLALLVALYTVAAHEPRRRAFAAAGVLEVGVVLASFRFAPTGGNIVASLVFLSGMVMAALLLGTTLRTRRAYLVSVMDRSAQLERERDQQAQLATVAERTRIAREMHDIVAHSLSVIITLADGAALASDADPQAATTAMNHVSRTGRQALAEMRRLLGVLHEDGDAEALAPQPGLDQLDRLLTDMRTAGLPVRLTVAGAPCALPPTAQTAVYRVVQEALTNTIKHGREPTTVRVGLHWFEAHLDIDIVDDGRPGGRPDSDGGGRGITGMRERMGLYGGAVTAGIRAGGGWRVHARLPLDRAAAGR